MKLQVGEKWWSSEVGWGYVMESFVSEDKNLAEASGGSEGLG